jgi:hypothetical protein
VSKAPRKHAPRETTADVVVGPRPPARSGHAASSLRTFSVCAIGTAQAAFRSQSRVRNHPFSRFQLAKLRLTTIAVQRHQQLGVCCCGDRGQESNRRRRDPRFSVPRVVQRQSADVCESLARSAQGRRSMDAPCHPRCARCVTIRSAGSNSRNSGSPPSQFSAIAGALYVTAKVQRVVIVRVFIKKTEKTPTGEFDLALQRAKEVKP